MKYFISGIDATTGEDRTILVEAKDKTSAVREARSQGVMTVKIREHLEVQPVTQEQPSLTFRETETQRTSRLLGIWHQIIEYYIVYLLVLAGAGGLLVFAVSTVTLKDAISTGPAVLLALVFALATSSVIVLVAAFVSLILYTSKMILEAFKEISSIKDRLNTLST